MNLLRALKEIKIFKNHDIYSEVVGVLQRDEIHVYNREKRRGGFNFYELIANKKVVGYVLKEADEVAICPRVSVRDDISKGFYVNFLEEPPRHISSYLVTTSKYLKPEPDTDKKRFNLYVQDEQENKQVEIIFVYDPKQMEIETFKLKTDDEFHLIGYDPFRSADLMEIMDDHGRKGFLMANTNYESKEGMFIQGLGIFIMFAVAIGIILFALANGWLVFGKILFIIGIVVAVVIIFIGVILKLILAEIIKQIWKRL